MRNFCPDGFTVVVGTVVLDVVVVVVEAVEIIVDVPAEEVGVVGETDTVTHARFDTAVSLFGSVTTTK